MRNKTPGKLEVLFLSFVGPNYSRSSTILNFESEILHKKYMQLPKGIWQSIQVIYKRRIEIRSSDCLVVMSPCHALTLALKLIGRKPLILDAGWSLTDGHISRGIKNLQIFKLPLIMTIDFISFHSADIVLVESEAQARRTNRLFAVRKSKIRVQFTGLNESSFNSDTSESNALLDVEKITLQLGFTLKVLFRGKINCESGFENILSAAKVLKDSVVFIFVVGKNDIKLEYPSNAIVVSEITDYELKKIYALSDISIGQVSNHRRLKYTIPHKAFEAGYFSMPYITADSVGVREYLHEGSAYFLSNPSAESLVNAIVDMKSNDVRSVYAEKVNLNYCGIASQRVLSEKFDQILLELCTLKANKFL